MPIQPFRKRLLQSFLCVFLLASLVVTAPGYAKAKAEAQAQAQTVETASAGSPAMSTTTITTNLGVDLDLYAQLLKRHTRPVSDLAGVRVDYQSLAESQDWKRLVRQVRAAKPSQASREERLAFWINAYNILAIDLILLHYPIDGIKEIGSFFSPVWKVDVATIEGKPLSLGEIEHEILRKMNEPFIHGAIICASASCPPLARHPFRAEQIDQDLVSAMRQWLKSREKGVSVDRENQVLRLSKIFKWFKGDFEARGGVLTVVAGLVDPAEAEWIRNHQQNLTIQYFDYDWTLNDLKDHIAK